MTTLFTALSPIFALIFIGYGLKRLQFPAEGFWPLLDTLTYYVLVPALLVHRLATASLEGTSDAAMMVKVVLGVLLLMSALLMAVQYVIKFSGPVYSSVYQGVIRYNTYVYLALVDALYGDEGIVLAAFLITFVIPVINVFCVSTFGLYVSEGRFSFKNLAKSVVTNPLILATALAVFLVFLNISIPGMVLKGLESLSQVASPFALFVLGLR